jgi:hypothetical protein
MIIGGIIFSNTKGLVPSEQQDLTWTFFLDFPRSWLGKSHHGYRFSYAMSNFVEYQFPHPSIWWWSFNNLENKPFKSRTTTKVQPINILMNHFKLG